MQSLRPTLLPSRHVQRGWRTLVSRHQKMSVIQVSSSGGGGGGFIGGGFGGGDDGDFEDPSFNFNLLSILTFISEPEKAIHSIAELAHQEQDNSQEQDISDEEEEEGYVKPAPKPKAEKMSLGPISSILFLLFLLSGGFFFWRRSRTRSAPSLSREGLIQRTREICLSPEEGEEEVQKETEEQDCYLITDLEKKDEFFNVERSESTNPTELLIPQRQEILKKTEVSEVTQIESLMEVEKQQKVQNFAEGLELAKTVEATTEQYYADLEAKDSFFNTTPKTELSKAQFPRTEFSKTKVQKTEFPKNSAQEPTDASVPILAPPETSKIEQDHEDPSNRLVTSPVSNNDEGSNQSSLTNFNENGTSSADPDLTLKDSEAEENKPPQKYLPIDDEVDLGPPIKPKGIDFNKELSWEEEGLFPGGKTPMNEKNHTMAYLLSRPNLLAEVVKQMESKPQNAKEEGQIKKAAAEEAKGVSGGSQKKKKRGKKSRR